MGIRKIKIFIFFFLFVTFLFVGFYYDFFVKTRAYEIEGNDEIQLNYCVLSKQNMVYYDSSTETAQEAIIEYVQFYFENGNYYDYLRLGYIIRNSTKVLYYSSNNTLSFNINYSNSSYNYLFIFTSNIDVYCWRYDLANNCASIYDDVNFNHQVSLDFSYNFASVNRNLEIFANQYNYEDVTNKIDNSFYFENLNNNFGNNKTGSCAYVAMGMLLGYYDIFVNNDIIDDDETYYSGDATSTTISGNTLATFMQYEVGNSFDLEDFDESPGSTNAFHNYLVYEIGRGHFNYGYNASSRTYNDGLNMQQVSNVLDYYLNDFAGLSASDYDINYHNTEQSIMDAIDNDKPVLLLCRSWSYDLEIDETNYVIDTYLNMGHVLIAYGYEETDDGVFFKCHAGWHNSGSNSFSDCFLLSFGLGETAGISLDINTSHVCSQAYINSQLNVEHPFCANCGSSGFVEIGTNNVLTHLHPIDTNNSINHLVFNNIAGPGFYKFTLNGTKTSGTMVYNSGAISLYNDTARTETIDRLDILNYNYVSLTNSDENSMWVYLPRNGYFYIDINMPNVSYTSLTLTISEASSQTVDIFDMTNVVSDANITLLSNVSDHSDYVKEIEIKQTGLFNLSYTCNGILNNNIDLFLIKKDDLDVFYSNSDGNNITIELEEGVYYLGYFNLTAGTITDFYLNRFIENSIYDVNDVLITDPDSGTPCGSQINIIEMNNNNKSYRGNNITVGFTRLIYFDQIDTYYSLSRLDYYWYSSDESKARVTQYGTVFGVSSTGNNETVTILAVLKSDPSIIFVKEFTINNDDGTGYTVVESNYNVKLSETNDGTFHLHLENINVPYPMYSYYIWNTTNISNGLVVANVSFGNYNVNGAGTFDLVGTNYIYNTSYITIVIIIHITVTNN